MILNIILRFGKQLVRFLPIVLLFLVACETSNFQTPTGPTDDGIQPTTTTTTVPIMPEIPMPRDDPLYMIGLYSPFHIPPDKAFLASLTSYGINGIRIFTGNNWTGGFKLYKDKSLEIDKSKFPEIRDFVLYCNNLGLIVQVVMFNRSNIQTAWHWDLEWYYHRDNWKKHEELAEEFVKALSGCAVIYDIDNEGQGGYDFEKFIYDILFDSGIPKRYISSCPMKDFASVDSFVGLMGVHDAFTSKFWGQSYGGLHYIYSSDGRIEGSSGIYQFNEPRWGAYPTVEEMERWAREVRRRNANLEFNFSGMLEVNGGNLPPHGIALLEALQKAIQKSS